MQHLIQTPSGHPLDEDVDVALVLCGSQTAHHVGVGEPAKHVDLVMQSLQLLLLVSLCVADIAHLRERERGGGGRGDHYAWIRSDINDYPVNPVLLTCLTAIMVPRRASLARKQEQKAPVPISFPFTHCRPSMYVLPAESVACTHTHTHTRTQQH